MALSLTPTAQTSFADALMADEALFDRLTAYSSVFGKFAKVLMREDVAPHLGLGDVANMAGVPLADVLAVASGRAVAAQSVAGMEDPPYSDVRSGRPKDFGEDSTLWLDLRPLLANGHEPLSEILQAVAALKPDQDLVVEATFHPVPLRRLLGHRGFLSMAECIANDHWRVRFRHRDNVRRHEAGTASCCGRCGGS